jgi:GWxTD domain-containing protein
LSKPSSIVHGVEAGGFRQAARPDLAALDGSLTPTARPADILAVVTHRHHAAILGLAIALVSFLASAAAASKATQHAREAATLYQRGLRMEKLDSFEGRREASRALERAVLLEPDSARYQLELAHLYLRMGFLGQARHHFERASQIDGSLAEAHLGQGLAWRRDYLKYWERGSLAVAIREFEAAAKLAPGRTDVWMQLVPMLVEQHRLREAMVAAEHAVASNPDHPEAQLAIGMLAYRLGQVERADSAFRGAIPRLSQVARERFLDIAPVASEEDTATMRRLPLEEQGAFVAHFWKENDPDLSTPENEAQLEYWARVTQAYFLYFNAHRQEWDQRGEVFVRYGPPEIVEYNPLSVLLRSSLGYYGVFPMNVLVWTYPSLGMVVPMQDRLLSEYYLPPISLVQGTAPAPDPDKLASQEESMATAGGRGVFPVLPPGTRRVPMAITVARYEGADGPRLHGWLETPGVPSDSLWGEWVVLDSTDSEVARIKRPLSAASCEPGELRAAEFATGLPPGHYLVGFSLRGTHGRRGTTRLTMDLPAPAARLDMSDVVVSCGTGDVATTPEGTPTVRFSARPGRLVRPGEPLTAYFEVYPLKLDDPPRSHMEFEYTVRSAHADPRIWIQRLISPRPALPDISAQRQEQQLGDIRRQFVSVPVQPLPPGDYRLDIRVRDLNGDVEMRRSVEFTKVSDGGS